MGFYSGDSRATRVYLGNTLIYQDGFGKRMFKKAYGSSTFTDISSNVVWDSNTSAFYANISNNVGDQVFVTFDNEEPKADYSNVLFYYVCTQVSGTFTLTLATPWTDGTNLSLVFLTL